VIGSKRGSTSDRTDSRPDSPLQGETGPPKPGSVEEIVAVESDLRRTQYTEDPATKRARVLAALDIQHQREGSRRREHPIEDLDRRIERLEAAIYVLTGQLADVESLAGLAQEQAESVAGAW
jgi:hypothetical protein